MSHASLTQELKGTRDSALVDASSPELGWVLWLKNSLGPFGCRWLSWAIWDPGSQWRVRENKQPGFPPSLDLVNIYYVAVLSILHTICSDLMPGSHSVLPLTLSPNVISSDSQSVHFFPSSLPHLCRLLPLTPMTMVTSGPGPADSRASSHPKCNLFVTDPTHTYLTPGPSSCRSPLATGSASSFKNTLFLPSSLSDLTTIWYSWYF